MRKLLVAIFRPNVWFFIGSAFISAFSGSISFEDRYNIWLAGADSRHQQWLEQMVVELKGGKVVSSDDECFCGTRVILVQQELYEYVKQGELMGNQASNYCPYSEMDMEMEVEVNKDIKI